MSKTLHDLLTLAGISIPEGLINPIIENIVCDSRNVKKGDLFLGCPGLEVDGGIFWESAIASGAVAAIIGSKAASLTSPSSSDPVLIVQMKEEIPGKIASIFWDCPSSKISLIGVTGTNGKTTIAYLIEYLSKTIGVSSALFGTLENRWPGFVERSSHTTSFPDKLQKNLFSAVNSGAELGAMEVSSHALSQKRVSGCKFSGAIFTNLTQDHLDYHVSMDAYFEAKALLFEQHFFDKDSDYAIINIDDPWGVKLANRMKERCWRSSIDPDKFYSSEIELKIKIIEKKDFIVKGLIKTPLGEEYFTSPLIGDFNLMNILQAIGVLLQHGFPLKKLVKALKNFPGVPGRMEKIIPLGKSYAAKLPTVLIDYAHTPDGLEKALIASKALTSKEVFCVFGCGGDRDRGKRAEMGSIAAKYANKIILTSDNPRSEEPKKILNDISMGINSDKSFIIKEDRSLAISIAIQQADEEDIVLIAGKGHEDYQILGNQIIYFSDREQAQIELEKKRLT